MTPCVCAILNFKENVLARDLGNAWLFLWTDREPQRCFCVAAALFNAMWKVLFSCNSQHLQQLFSAIKKASEFLLKRFKD